MPRKPDLKIDRLGKESASEELDELNNRIRSEKVPAPELIEAEIEEKAKRRRKAEKPATTGWKST